MSNFHDVGKFHLKFGLDNTTFEAPGPRVVPTELIDFRVKFLEEELEELKEGLRNQDMAKVADSLVDLAYVTFGFAHILGLPWETLWDEVQRANMEKERALRAEQSTRGSTYDVIKPAGWRPPNIENILEIFGWPGK